MDNKPVVFISHANEDSTYAEIIIDLLKEINVPQENILCTSVVGYRIEQGKLWNDVLHDIFLKRNPYMIFIHSDNFYKSPVCMNEVGAAWVLNLRCFSLLVPGFEYRDMDGVIPSTVLSTKMDAAFDELFEYCCNLKDDLIERYSLKTLKDAVWYRAVKKFYQDSAKLAAASTRYVNTTREARITSENIKDNTSSMHRYHKPTATNKKPYQYVDESLFSELPPNRVAILRFLKQQARPCTLSEISSFVACTVETTRKNLNHLLCDSLVEAIDSGGKTCFSLKKNIEI